MSAYWRVSPHLSLLPAICFALLHTCSAKGPTTLVELSLQQRLLRRTHQLLAEIVPLHSWQDVWFNANKTLGAAAVAAGQARRSAVGDAAVLGIWELLPKAVFDSHRETLLAPWMVADGADGSGETAHSDEVEQRLRALLAPYRSFFGRQHLLALLEVEGDWAIQALLEAAAECFEEVQVGGQAVGCDASVRLWLRQQVATVDVFYNGVNKASFGFVHTLIRAQWPRGYVAKYALCFWAHAATAKQSGTALCLMLATNLPCWQESLLTLVPCLSPQHQAPLAAALCALLTELPPELLSRPSPVNYHNAGALYRAYAQALSLPTNSLGSEAVSSALRHLQCAGNCLALMHMVNVAFGASQPARSAQAAPMLGMTAVATAGCSGRDGGPTPGLRAPPFEGGHPGHFHCMLLGPNAKIVTESQLLVVQSCEFHAWRATRGIDCMPLCMERVGAALRGLREVLEAAAISAAAAADGSPTPQARARAHECGLQPQQQRKGVPSPFAAVARLQQGSASEGEHQVLAEGEAAALQEQQQLSSQALQPEIVSAAAVEQQQPGWQRHESSASRQAEAVAARAAAAFLSPRPGEGDELTPPTSAQPSSLQAGQGESVTWYVNSGAVLGQRSSGGRGSVTGGSDEAVQADYGHRASEETANSQEIEDVAADDEVDEGPVAGLRQWLEQQRQQNEQEQVQGEGGQQQHREEHQLQFDGELLWVTHPVCCWCFLSCVASCLGSLNVCHLQSPPLLCCSHISAV